MKKRSFILICILAFVKLGFSQTTVDEIIQKHLEITGYKNIPTELKKLKIEGSLLQDKKSYPLIIHNILPDKFRMSLIYSNLDFITVAKGSTKWEYNPMIDSLITSSIKRPQGSDFLEHLCGVLYLYKKGDLEAKLLGTATIDDIEVYKLEVTFANKIKLYYVDKLSYLIIRIDEDLKEFDITYYSDYRKTGNYFLPYKLSSFVGKIPSLSMQFNTLEINPEISESLFNKPKTK